MAEEKFCILFTSEFNVGGNDLKFHVWASSYLYFHDSLYIDAYPVVCSNFQKACASLTKEPVYVKIIGLRYHYFGRALASGLVI